MTTQRADGAYASYAELARRHLEGADFQVRIAHRPESGIAILAPHGGAIEEGTSEVAQALAGVEFNLYLFEGLRAAGNYAALHLTSHRFDEPRCLELLAGCDHVIAIHGCRGDAPQALLGGLDTALKERIGAAIATTAIDVRMSGHQYRAVHPHNICNRGRRRAGVQIELTTALRFGQAHAAMVSAIRSVLLAL